MSKAGQSAASTKVQTQVPWWLGRGVGLALVTSVIGLGWTVSWGLAARLEATPPAVSSWSEPNAEAFSPVAARSGVTPPDVPVLGDSRGGFLPSSPSREMEESTAAEPAGDMQSQPLPTEFALQAQALRERKQQRVEQALRADQQLAQFIESVGVLDPMAAWGTPLSTDYRITASFGQAGSLWSNDHTGVDLAAPAGTPVASVAAGTVAYAGDSGAYGLQVKITHPDGTETSYAHLSRIDVSEGQTVQQGAVIGAVGSTGNSTGPHLHLELRPAGGGPVDPVDALLARGVTL